MVTSEVSLMPSGTTRPATRSLTRSYWPMASVSDTLSVTISSPALFLARIPDSAGRLLVARTRREGRVPAPHVRQRRQLDAEAEAPADRRPQRDVGDGHLVAGDPGRALHAAL